MTKASARNRFDLGEWAGAVGDFGTLVPIVFGAALATGMDLAPVLIGFAMAYIATGLVYRLPVPVEPMKVIGAVAIAGGLTASQVRASGYLLGVIFLILVATGVMAVLSRLVSQSVVRGIQLGLGLILARTSLDFMMQDPTLAGVSIALILTFVILRRVRDISALLVMGLALVVGVARHGLPQLTPWVPALSPLPTAPDFFHAFHTGVLPQIPLTVGNAIMATSLLMKDLLGRDIREDRLARTVGAMCFLGAPVGAFPMCTGSGGLAAQYRFGARTGGSNIISGCILLVVGLLFASPHTLLLVPPGALGALLLFSSLELARAAMKTENPGITLLTGLLAAFSNLGVAFIAGMLVDHGLNAIGKWTRRG